MLVGSCVTQCTLWVSCVRGHRTDEGTLQSGMLSYGLGREKPKHSKDIARITFDVYKQNPRDLFGSLNVKATFYGLYSMSCDFQGLGPKKVLRSVTTMSYFPIPLQLQHPSFLLQYSSTHNLSLVENPLHSLLPCSPNPSDLVLCLPFRELLRWTSALLQGLGHMLLGISSSLRHLIEGAEQWHWQRQGRLHPY